MKWLTRWWPARVGWAWMILISWVLLVVVEPMLSLDPNRIMLSDILTGPSPNAWLGHDDLGRPIWDRLVAGARISLCVSVSVSFVSCLIGTIIGTLSAWLGGILDHIVARIMDIFLAFPGILLAIAMAGILGPGIGNIVIALVVVGWVGFARLARAQTLSLKHRDHVRAALALGCGFPRILWRHLLPLLAAPLIVEATFGVANVVIAEAGLSFLGLGVQPPMASWGGIIREGARYMLVAPHLVLAPGVVLMLVVLSINILGDRLRDWMDVRLPSRSRLTRAMCESRAFRV
uniref:Peptide/nickel transport system permease protein n=1 Tax=Candidatus Kentrum sp. TC TaxID=2126339 RepID=A0A450Y7W5_9GAMM|nr:MAG: peptide/nickel transport system permease protein [Candidatus Kentron sp. TC]VFK40837.1 MAG: peptide/nickel transport system permease protein [Candidatus Kentron sp. TC]VFK53677.1 MAG: peptide/nickel transport system permease protein [Candidatus Kentron sp. TC]